MPSLSFSQLLACGGAALCLALSTAALGQKVTFQPGYVILTAAPTDTVRGEIDLHRAARTQPQLTFRPPGGEARQYPLSELHAAGNNAGLHLRKRPVPVGDANVPTLLQVLVAGPASLYLDPTGKLPATYYLDKPGVAPLPLKKPQFVQVLRTAFADCPTVNTQVAYMGAFEYSADALRRYVVNYNRCMSPQATVSTPVVPKTGGRLRWGVELGAARLQHFYPYLRPQQTFYGPVTPTGGAFAWLPLNRFLGLVGGFTLSSLRSDNTARQLAAGSYEQIMRYRTQGVLLRVPLNVRCTLRAPDAAWRPYVQVGGHASQIVRGRMYWHNRYPDPSAPYQTQDLQLYYEGIGRGIQVEAGLLLRCGPGQVGASLRYEQTYGFPNTGRTFSTDLNQLSLALNYTY
jgi:hypothetical protein